MLKSVDHRLLGINAALIAIGAVILLGIVAATVVFAQRTEDQAQQGLEAGAADRRILRIYTILVDSETAQRGYLLTRDDRYLEPYVGARARIATEFEILRRQITTLGEPATLPDITRLEGIAERKFAELDRTIALARQGRDAEVIAVVRSDDGLAMMAEARAFVAAFQAVTGALRTDRIRDMRRSTTTLTYLTAFSALTIFGLIAGVVVLMLRNTREIERARRALAEVNVDLAGSNADLEDRVRERTEGLLRANEEVQRYAYIVSHDLRAPLVNIMGFTGEIETAVAGMRDVVEAMPPESVDPAMREAIDADIPEALSFIRTSMTRMDALINEILKLSRLGRRTLEATPIDAAALVAECIETIHHRIDSAGATVTVEGSLPDLVTDRSALQQILTNLLDNAAKYLDSSRPGRILVRGRRTGALATFEVTDNGRGIAPTDHERIFELFRRSGVQDRPGEGIGLAHVRSLVRRLGGDITVESDGRSGTTFRFTIERDLRPRVRSEQN